MMRSESNIVTFKKRKKTWHRFMWKAAEKLDMCVEGVPEKIKMGLVSVLLLMSCSCVVAAVAVIESGYAYKPALLWFLAAIVLFAPAKYLEVHTEVPYIC